MPTARTIKFKLIRMALMVVALCSVWTAAMADGSPKFDQWMEGAHGRFLSHGIWEDNVDRVLSSGFLKPAELILRETGEISYEREKSYGVRSREVINKDELVHFAQEHPLFPVVEGLAYVRIIEDAGVLKVQLRTAAEWKTLRSYKGDINK